MSLHYVFVSGALTFDLAVKWEFRMWFRGSGGLFVGVFFPFHGFILAFDGFNLLVRENEMIYVTKTTYRTIKLCDACLLFRILMM